jgi:transcriptional regulator with XRE-family HTH domain
MTETVGHRIREAREARSLSVRRLAELALGSESNARQITVWEKGHVSPTIDSLQKIAPHLHVAVADLIPNSTIKEIA